MSEGLTAAATDTSADISEEDPIAAADTTGLRGTWPTKGYFALSISNTKSILDSEKQESMLSTRSISSTNTTATNVISDLREPSMLSTESISPTDINAISDLREQDTPST
jgi:hypothetical protein